MILFFGDSLIQVFAVKCDSVLPSSQINKLSWLFGDQPLIKSESILNEFYGPRSTMVTPWSTNAVEITQNMGVEGIERIEVYEPKSRVEYPDPMLITAFSKLDQAIFDVELLPEAVQEIKDIATYNKQEGLALSNDEVIYL